MGFPRPYRLRHLPPIAARYTYAIVTWTLAVLLVCIAASMIAVVFVLAGTAIRLS